MRISFVRKIVSCVVGFLLLLPAYAGEKRNLVPEHPAEDFVRVYVELADPGTMVYSILGHAALRLSCPSRDRDFVFTYEGENVADNIQRYIRGTLLMGVRAVAYDIYCAEYRKENRAIHQYELNLPIHVKQRLWQQMDERLNEDDVPYDCIEHGCAVSVLGWIIDAADPDSLQFGRWPDNMLRTRAEIASDSIDYPWNHFFLRTIIAGVANESSLPYEEKLTVPSQLPQVLARATYNGHPLLVEKDLKKVSFIDDYDAPWHEHINPFLSLFRKVHLLPTLVALLLLILTLVGQKLKKVVWFGLPTMLLCGILGLFVTYLVVFPSMPNNEWNWLIVPFNPLPYILWHWRKKWGRIFMFITVFWIVGMMTAPHNLVDTAHLVLALAQAVCFWTPKEVAQQKGRQKKK